MAHIGTTIKAIQRNIVYTSELGGRQFLSGSTQGAEDAATHGVLC